MLAAFHYARKWRVSGCEIGRFFHKCSWKQWTLPSVTVWPVQRGHFLLRIGESVAVSRLLFMVSKDGPTGCSQVSNSTTHLVALFNLTVTCPSLFFPISTCYWKQIWLLNLMTTFLNLISFFFAPKMSETQQEYTKLLTEAHVCDVFAKDIWPNVTSKPLTCQNRIFSWKLADLTWIPCNC